MKRHASLAQLSREHHFALVLAKRAQRMPAAAEATPRVMAELVEKFARELEPHFLAEESVLLPALRGAGQTALAERTQSEHEELRNLAIRLNDGDQDSLRRFGELLEAHVRFEERELFRIAESVLTTAALASIAHLLHPPTHQEPDLCNKPLTCTCPPTPSTPSMRAA